MGMQRWGREGDAVMGCDLLWRWKLLAGGEDKWWIWKAMRTQGDHTASNTKAMRKWPPPALDHRVPAPVPTLPALAAARGAAPVHDAGGHGAEDDGHAEEADPTDDPGQHWLRQEPRELRAGRIHLHACANGTQRHRGGYPWNRHPSPQGQGQSLGSASAPGTRSRDAPHGALLQPGPCLEMGERPALALGDALAPAPGMLWGQRQCLLGTILDRAGHPTPVGSVPKAALALPAVETFTVLLGSLM